MTNGTMAARTVGVVLVAGALAAGGARLQAREESKGETNRTEARAIEGVWEPVVTIRDCQSGAPLFTFVSMDSYIRGGSYVGESASEPPARATGFGRWQHAGGRKFTVSFQFFTYSPTGQPTGRLRVSSWIRLAADRNSFTSSESTEISDLNGNVVGHVCGTREGRRVY